MLFSKPKINHKQDVLQDLSEAYRAYNSANWIYYKPGGYYRVGTLLVDGCIESSKQMQHIAEIIGEGLLEDNKDAEIASMLFQRLYTNGFAGGFLRQEIQSNFKQFLPQDTIEQLNNGETMSNCMKSIALDKQTASLGRAQEQSAEPAIWHSI